MAPDRATARWPRATAWMRVAAWVLAGTLTGAFAVGTLGACGSAATANKAGVSKNNAVVRFASPPEDAEVWVDGRFYPGALRGGIEVPPGLYRVEIRHDDYHTLYLELRLAKGERKQIPVRLAKKLD